MKKIFLIFILLIPLCTHAQQDRFKWRFGVQSGIMSYYGDLNRRFLPANQKLIDREWDFLSHSISIERNLSIASALKLSFSKGQFIANDRAVKFNGDLLTSNELFNRSLNVMTEIEDVSFQYIYYFDNDRFFGKNAFFAPYLGIGAGFTRFAPYADLLNAAGDRYYYWSDLTIRDMPEGNIGANVIEQDGNFETYLPGIETEGQDYKTNAWHLAATLGFKIRLASRFNLNFEYSAKYTSTDYLDDAAGDFQNFPNSFRDYANNPAEFDGQRNSESRWNDIYSTLTVGLYYNFGKKKQAFKIPAIYTSIPSSKTGEKTLGLEVEKKKEASKDTKSDSLSNAKTTVVTSDLKNGSKEGKKSTDAVMPDSLNKEVSKHEEGVSFKNLEEAKSEEIFDDSWGKYVYAGPYGYLFLIDSSKTNYELVKGADEDIVLADHLEKTEEIKVGDETVFIQPNGKDSVFIVENPITAKTAKSDTVLVEKVIKPENPRVDTVIVEKNNFSVMPPIARTDSVVVSVDVNAKNTIQGSGLIISPDSIVGDSIKQDTSFFKVLDSTNVSGFVQLQQDVAVLKAQMEMLILLQKQQNTMSSLQEELRNINQKLDSGNAKKNVDDELESLKKQLLELSAKYENLRTDKVSEDDTSKKDLETLALYQKTILYFPTNVSQLSQSDKDKLNALAAYLKNTDFQIGIRGYTDKVGNAMYNQKLAMKRAEAAKQHLISQGVSSSRITIDYAAPDQSIKDLDASYGRRVEIELGN